MDIGDYIIHGKRASTDSSWFRTSIDMSDTEGIGESQQKPLGNVMLTEKEKISDDCHTCKPKFTSQRRFKFTIGADDLQFNDRIIVDKMFIDSKPVIHMIFSKKRPMAKERLNLFLWQNHGKELK